MADTMTNMTRRQALRRGAAAGAVIWTVPMVVSNTAHANSGSFGSKIEGRLKSVTLVWKNGHFQPNQGTATQPAHSYATDTFMDINVGKGWQTIARGDQFVIPAGMVLQFRPWQGQSGGRSATPTDEPVVEDVVTEDTQAPTTTAAPITTQAPAPAPVDAEPVAPTTAAPAPTDTTPATTAAAPVPTTAPTAAIDTIVIDMSGRTEIEVGEVFGYFQVVDAVPA